jgi:hypothetical protein
MQQVVQLLMAAATLKPTQLPLTSPVRVSLGARCEDITSIAILCANEGQAKRFHEIHVLVPHLVPACLYHNSTC